METPTISKAQRKSTLSGKKTKIKETIKNVVATPYNTSYWPLISSEDQESLKGILQNNLPRIKPNKVNVPWNLLKEIPKPDRKQFRSEYTKSDIQVSKEDRKGFIIGINDVTNLLDDNLVSVILISSDVQPRLMVQHVIDEAVLYRVPVIVMGDLRSILSTACGISGAAVGISKDVDSHSKLNVIKESVVQIYAKHPPPEDHINYQRSLGTADFVQKSRENSDSMEKSQDLESSCQLIDEKPILTKTEDTDDEALESMIYLKRDSKAKRVFVPESSSENVKVHKMEVDSTGFLPFSETSVPTAKRPQTKSIYKSLVVKRLRGDPNRKKRKIESLKKKIK